MIGLIRLRLGNHYDKATRDSCGTAKGSHSADFGCVIQRGMKYRRPMATARSHVIDDPAVRPVSP